MKRTGKRLDAIERALNGITVKLESSHFYEYLEYVSDTKRMLGRVFLAGIMRGLGMAIGFSLLGALIIYVLNIIAQSNLPYIADFIAKIIRIVESKN